MFIDRAKIHVRGGDGGNGVTAFRREKFVPRGGPSGGDGGRGGSIYLESTTGLNTLLHFRYNPEHTAERGKHGEGSKRSGSDGKDIVLKVPAGTLVIDETTGETIFDLTELGKRVQLVAGGRGGRGNAQFATPINRAPRYHEEGRPGGELYLVLELKLIADVGLVGMPNAGKSTLISRISAARPKIADYPFTTLEPHLGVVDLGDYKTFVVADIPGLIEGAHEGAGLGDRFLRHIERTRILLHLVDVAGFDSKPVDDYKSISHELEMYGSNLANKPKIVVATKLDALSDDDRYRIDDLKLYCESNNLEFYEISAASGHGIPQLLRAVERKLNSIEKTEQSENEAVLSH